jgi:beta-phosphoglucomutase-like phosphatase (HAD superfamily)
MIKALIFDMNGTMINDMEYHTIAWNKIFNQFNASTNKSVRCFFKEAKSRGIKLAIGTVLL